MTTIAPRGIGRKGNERVARLREKMLTAREVCVERGYWVTASYKETESEPPVIRRAKALQKVLENISIRIEDDELIAGWATSKQRGSIIMPESDWEGYLEGMDTIATREFDRFAPLTEQEKTKMRDYLPYWKGKSLSEKWLALVPEDLRKLSPKFQLGVAAGYAGMGHLGVDFERVLAEGLNGVKKQVAEELGRLNLAEVKDFEKYQFLRAVNITLEAAMGFAARYADLARDLAGKETDARRKTELARMAEACRQVPANPARGFYEAVQSVWMTYIVCMIGDWGGGQSFGRPDQYLYPFFQKDLGEGEITREGAYELLALLLIKCNGLTPFMPRSNNRFNIGGPLLTNITLGGLTRGGRDAVNELSYLFLDAEAAVGLNEEEFIIRIHKSNPEAFVMKACEVAKLLRGKFKFMSDDTIIPQLLSDGKPLEYARDYIITGCNSPTVPGRSYDLPGAVQSLPLMLELALNNGVSRLTGEQLGPRTGDPRKFQSYDEVWAAYRKQVEDKIPVALFFKNAPRALQAQYAPSPFISALFRGCIEKGLDINNGGTAPYLSYAISLGGAPNVGDSLVAIKKLVFQEKKMAMGRLIDALDKNFEGEEEIWHLLKVAPKFGNDDDEVDSIVNEVLMHAAGEIKKNKGFAGAVSNAAAATVTSNIPLGEQVGALPDGRRAGEPISEGGISPHQGRNVNGSTATMRSVAKLDLVKLTNGAVLNMRFSPDALKDEQKIRKFAAMVRTYLETGGVMVQFNILKTATLRDAQQHPEKYQDLLVRVATYSSYFVELSPELQNDIIARMEFSET